MARSIVAAWVMALPACFILGWVLFEGGNRGWALMSKPFFERPRFWFIVALILLPLNIASVLWNASVPAILALCVNIAVVTTPLWRRPRQ